jgi:hypothetical protein
VGTSRSNADVAGRGAEKTNLKLPVMRRGEDVVQVGFEVFVHSKIVTMRWQEWQQGVAEALKANLLNGSTSPTKARPSSAMPSGKQGMQVTRETSSCAAYVTTSCDPHCACVLMLRHRMLIPASQRRHSSALSAISAISESSPLVPAVGTFLHTRLGIDPALRGSGDSCHHCAQFM